jgi:hypothetical protein
MVGAGEVEERCLVLAVGLETGAHRGGHKAVQGSSEPPPSSLQPAGLHVRRPQGEGELRAPTELAAAPRPPRHRPQGDLPAPGSVARRSSAAKGSPFGARRPEMARPAARRSWRSNHLICSRKRELCWRSGRSICSRKSGSGKGLLASAGGAATRGGAGGGATDGEGVRAAE